jgi:flavin-dependent dehydrogenase
MASRRIVIVGAGPAGASLAICLARAGENCLLLDARNFPRAKLCGGGITRKTRDLVLPLVGESAYLGAVKASSSEIEIRYDGSTVQRFATETPFDFVDRSLYDLAFVDAYVNSGGRFSPGVRAMAIDPTRRRLETSSGSVDYDILVCADGAASGMRRCLEPDYRPEGFCYEYARPDSEGSLVHIDFFSALRGYSWSFPNGGNRVIGTGSFYREPADARALRKFLEIYGPLPEKLSGAFIPLGENPILRPRAGGTIHFLGDAAGLANPVTGEGLYFATKAAILLAESLSGKRSETSYLASMRAIGRTLRMYAKAQDIVFSPRVWKNLTKEGRSHEGFRRICDGIISRDESPLAFLAGHAGRKLARALGFGKTPE